MGNTDIVLASTNKEGQVDITSAINKETIFRVVIDGVEKTYDKKDGIARLNELIKLCQYTKFKVPGYTVGINYHKYPKVRKFIFAIDDGLLVEFTPPSNIVRVDGKKYEMIETDYIKAMRKHFMQVTNTVLRRNQQKDLVESMDALALKG